MILIQFCRPRWKARAGRCAGRLQLYSCTTVASRSSAGKVFDAYANKMSSGKDAMCFLLDGDRIGEDQTSDTLDMDDGDQIDMVLKQVRRWHTLEHRQTIT